MTKIIEGDWIMEKNEVINDNLIVRGNISGKDGKRFNLTCLDLNCFDLNCKDLKCFDLNCFDLNCKDLNCDNLTCLDLNCKDLKCFDLNCKDLKCFDLNCFDLNCKDLNCDNLTCLDLNCLNLTCQGDVSYYAVAFAYKDIKCKSIKGERENSRHFVLDGKIIIDGKKLKEVKK